MNSFHARGRRAAKPASAAAPRTASGPRADQRLVECGLADSRSAARRMIEAGRVTADGVALAKPSQILSPAAQLSVRPAEDDRYVSRGGLKLAGALAHTGLDPRGARCLDVGQSTGGFSDCLLQAGALRVVGVEVGHGQLHPRLRDDPRLACLEGINARELSPALLGEEWPAAGFDLLVCDASFISLTLLLSCWPALLAPRGEVLSLVKPQFEVGPGGLGKGGIVRDPARYAEVEAKLRAAFEAAGLEVADWFDSPITGGDGNHEFFVHAHRLGRHEQDLQ